MAYFDNDFDDLFNELNNSFFNNTNDNGGAISIYYFSSMNNFSQGFQPNAQGGQKKRQKTNRGGLV